jgi:hypothetical protein
MTILRTAKYTTILVGISLVFLFVEIQYAFDIMEHLLRNILANLNICTSDEIKQVLREELIKMYDNDIIYLIEKSMDELVETIEKLQEVKEMDPEVIRRIATSNAANH